jgi:hypothetical protein
MGGDVRERVRRGLALTKVGGIAVISDDAAQRQLPLQLPAQRQLQLPLPLLLTLPLTWIPVDDATSLGAKTAK